MGWATMEGVLGRYKCHALFCSGVEELMETGENLEWGKYARIERDANAGEFVV
jgi:hypothetical protein